MKPFGFLLYKVDTPCRKARVQKYSTEQNELKVGAFNRM